MDLLPHLFLGRCGQSEYEGIFRNDPKLFYSSSKLPDLIAALFTPLIHLIKQLVVATLGSKEDHCAAAIGNSLQRFIGVMIHGVDTSFRPPFHFFGSDELCEIDGTFFGDKEIVVVKLECIRAETIF